ncbi:hypothetical protein PhCBS80983_g00412 [Powellomyces hirtus]|uniref:Transmembrane protein n=1 Tax=Powellomyces hirtus TaxID=109895 RepID=A0A507EFV6_9FUNG|nr:hypothetical protein PhCBS80983_g00412 [Powellomyces hirtus]
MFNTVLAGCMILYAASFVPLLFTSRRAVELSFFEDSPDSPLHKDFKKLQSTVRVWTALYGLATFPYVILVQIRFRVVKAVFKYHKNWDTAYIVVTTVIWLGVLVVCGVVYPPSPQLQGMATTGWTIYALASDNVLSFIFISQLFEVRRQLNKGIEVAFRKVRRSLFFLCFMTWIGLSISLIGWTRYATNGMMRTLLFRASLTFSPLAYSGALVYIYTVRTLFSAPRASKLELNGNKDNGVGQGPDKRNSRQILHTAAASTSNISSRNIPSTLPPRSETDRSRDCIAIIPASSVSPYGPPPICADVESQGGFEGSDALESGCDEAETKGRPRERQQPQPEMEKQESPPLVDKEACSPTADVESQISKTAIEESGTLERSPSM